MYKNNADKSLNQKSVPFCQLPIFLRKILANKTALFLYATLGFNPKNKKENPFHENQDRVIFNIKF